MPRFRNIRNCHIQLIKISFAYTCPRIGKVCGPKLLVSITACVVKLADDVEFFIAPVATAAGVEAWNVALADELRALGEGAGKVGGKPGEPLPRRP